MADSNPTTATNTDVPEHPSMIGGHAKYIQGAVTSALGYSSGEATKESAIQEMRRASDASQNSPPAQSSILGTVEKKLGELTGCEGMEKEGEQRLPIGSEEASGTG